MVETSRKVVGANGQMETNIQNTMVKISGHTQKMVGSYMKMDTDVTKTLTNLYIGSTKITDDTVKSLDSKYANMATQIKTGMDKHYTDEYNSMQQFFGKSSALSATEEATALANLQKNNADKKTETDNYTRQILYM